MVVSYAGRLPGTQDFPDRNVAYVREQVERLLANLRPRVVVGSAAAGADLLVVDAALRSGGEAKLVLAGTSAEFRATSVAQHGDEWGRLFDAAIAHARVDLIEVPRHDDDSDSYAAVTTVMQDLAEAEAQDGEPIVGLNVSAARAGTDHSGALAQAHELRDRLVLRLDPARTADDAPVAFVAMPFGRRSDHTRGWTDYNADATYRRIILPALIDAGYRPVRADTEGLLEVIDLTMLRALYAADVVVADLATLNPNVMWEVGVRHAWRRAGTILIRPDGTDPPFDVSHARVHAYQRDETKVADPDAVAGIRLLRGLLEAVSEQRIDSPVFATLPELPEPPAALRAPRPQAAAAAQRHMEEISLSADLCDGDALEQKAEAIAADDELDDAARGPLLEQVGMALIGVGRHATAVDVLRPLVQRDAEMQHVRLQQQYSHALIRSGPPQERSELLAEAERRLQALVRRGSVSGETFGLLGSAAKARVEAALAAGQPPGAQLDVAIDAYLEGFRRDPGDHYPGVVALALLRMRGQRVSPNEDDVLHARDLAPVVSFAAARLGEAGSDDPWRLATLAELALHEYLLYDDNDDALVQATTRYARLAAVGGPDHRLSAIRQLSLLRNAGDPPEVLDALIELLAAAS